MHGIGHGVRRKKWMADVAEKMHRGALTRAAKAAGMSNEEWAKQHFHAKGKAGPRARFYFKLTGKEAPE